MRTAPANANGHRRRQLRKRVLAEETHCALCGEWVDKTLGYLPDQHGPNCPGDCAGCIPHPKRAEVDEDLPRSRGGSPLERTNTHLLCRTCNQFKSNLTLDEARAKRAGLTTPKSLKVTASPIW